jgi:hypothetical protein
VAIITFMYFTGFFHYLVVYGANIFVLLLYFIAFAAAQNPYAQSPDVGRAVRAIHTACGVSAACSARHQRSIDDGLRRVDGTCGPVASEDSHVLPFM